MHASLRNSLALALLPELIVARSVGIARRSVSCAFAVAPSAGDTCSTFASRWGATVAKLESLNPTLDCNNFNTSGTYCVIGTVTPDPTSTTTTTTTTASETTTTSTSTSTSTTTTTSQASTTTASGPSPTQSGVASNCDNFYQVVSGDSCGAIESKYGITNDQFVAWNPSVDSGCSNLWLGYYVCVHVPGATTSAPSQPSPTTGPSPTQPGIASNCDNFYKVASGDQCGTIESKYGITAAQFGAWNPYIDSSCANLWVDYYVCVHVPGASTTAPSQPSPTSGPSPTQPGIASNCDNFYKVASGDQCGSIESKYGISAAQFSAWNPYIDSNCSNLWVDYYVCVHVPGASTTAPSQPSPTASGPQPQMPNLAAGCTTFYQVVAGDGCWAIEQKFGITDAQFLKWNPSVDASCDNLWVGYYVCAKA